jgi:ADP-ribose pyrophosphatase YjhB (NUDIX family)
VAVAAPERPQLAVSAAIFRGGEVLLVRRARQPAKGLYTAPGGRVEHGESLTDAVMREVREETGLAIAVEGLAGWREALPRDGRGGHFVILCFAARWLSGEVALNEELDAHLWRRPDDLADLATTEGLADILAAAARLAG